MNAQPVAGVVLAGGLSTRLGQDKAALRLAAGGPDLLARTHALLRGLLPRCWVSCRADKPRLGYACVFDAVPGKGPMGGIVAALTRARDEGFAAVLALSCDLPFMDAPTLARLLAARQAALPQTLLTCYAAAATGRLEPLAGIYEVAALPLLLDHAGRAGRGSSLFRLFPADLCRTLPYGPEAARPFFNLNTAADLAAAQRLAAAAEPAGEAGALGRP
ncbi:molybdenum cofactor guanylyltransferase [Desulfovibrio legallii]|jgi:molybdopterin-guanine dinucleotide biosynthesis protein A|uniref:Probable molybdenum cofactor guanylyltransferase n=1 Tax=Desulfovibrio legallii TaxID=571438 RepID=A0A1G7INM3_9BACT|nr:molybdenum cofactor guanylyltransferase [Desulfovibrio legallii]SDF14215.1 molybdopterin-guanine dinucleotide biosynthesis protein A [Desulfovibrio legallii]